jgi:hypothetical protein
VNKIRDFFLYIKANFFIIILIAITVFLFTVYVYTSPKSPPCSFCNEEESTFQNVLEYENLCDNCYSHLEWYLLEELYDSGKMEDFIKERDGALIYERGELYDIYALGFQNGYTKGLSKTVDGEVEDIVDQYNFELLQQVFDSYWEQE